MKKRVLHVLQSMNIGGIETYIMNLLRNIDTNKYEFHFLLWEKSKSYYEDEIIELGGFIHKFHFSKNPIINIIRFRKFLNNHNYDIIHCHCHFYSGIFAYAAKNKKAIFISHIHSKSDNKENNLLRKIYKSISRRLLINYSTYYCACSDEAAKYVLGNHNKDAIIMNDYINVNDFINVSEQKIAKIKKDYSISKNDFIIGNVGRLSVEKNQKFILELLKDLKDTSDRNYKCLFIGDGPEKVELQKYIIENKLENKVIFAGNVSDVWNYLKCMDIFVFPSLYEGFGMALLEAQASGIRCISSDCVPKSTDMDLNLVKYFPLYDKSKWIEELLKESNIVVDNMTIKEKIREKGFDVTNSICQIEKLYDSEGKNET